MAIYVAAYDLKVKNKDDADVIRAMKSFFTYLHLQESVWLIDSMLSAVDDENVMLPVGMQITGKWFDERMIYRVGAAWERGFDWKNGERRRE